MNEIQHLFVSDNSFYSIWLLMQSSLGWVLFHLFFLAIKSTIFSLNETQDLFTSDNSSYFIWLLMQSSLGWVLFYLFFLAIKSTIFSLNKTQDLFTSDNSSHFIRILMQPWWRKFLLFCRIRQGINSRLKVVLHYRQTLKDSLQLDYHLRFDRMIKTHWLSSSFFRKSTINGELASLSKDTYVMKLLNNAMFDHLS